MKFNTNKFFAVLLLTASMFMDVDSRTIPAGQTPETTPVTSESAEPSATGVRHGRHGGRYTRRGRHCTRKGCNNNVKVTGKVSSTTGKNKALVCTGSTCRRATISKQPATPTRVRTMRGTFRPRRGYPRYGRHGRFGGRYGTNR